MKLKGEVGKELGKKQEIVFLGKIGKKTIKLMGDSEQIDCSPIDEAIIDYIGKVVKYYAERLLNFQNPSLELEETDEGDIGYYVFNEDDEDVKSKYYYVQIGKILKEKIIYKIDFTKEDFKLMP